jgi:hypothetical protein
VLDVDDDEDDHEMPEIIPIPEVTAGKVFGIGDDKLKIVTMISSGGND